MITLKVSAPKVERSVEVVVDIPETFAELVTKYGEDVVASAAIRSLRIAAQGFLRPMVEAGKTDAEVAEAAANWVPGAERDTTSTLIAKVGKMSAEEKAALMKALGL